MPATLQDYFRWDPNEKLLRSDKDLIDAGLLIRDESGKQPDFHLLHLPQTYEDGATTFKAELEADAWPKQEAEIARLISRSGQTDKAIGQQDCTSADHRAQLSGAVLNSFPNWQVFEMDTPLHLVANSAAFLTFVNASGLEFGSPTEFSAALFRSGAHFSRAQFSAGDAKFNNVQFSGGQAYFFDARFSGGRANFNNAQFSGGDSFFSEAHFSGGGRLF
jgi:hypothetical protein